MKLQHNLGEFQKEHFEALKGIERECLRVDKHGRISQKPHPYKVGSKLTNKYITTDYGEALLEFVTPTFNDNSKLYSFLQGLHCYTLSKMDGETLWPFSMPPYLESDDEIIIADYGTSHTGQLKTLYRKGLSYRYGKSMQVISGVHYNFSFSDELIDFLYQKDSKNLSKSEFINDYYIVAIRNFKKYAYILVDLFGASPLCDESFLKNKKHGLIKQGSRSYGREQNTTLRMDRLGYTSDAQKSIQICHNSLDSYIESIEMARLTSFPDYEKIGLKDSSGKRLQLSTNILQIDNEYYSTVRPKRAAKSGQSGTGALHEDGIEYLEIRLMDVNPFDSAGISTDQLYFLETFMFVCGLASSPMFNDLDCEEVEENFMTAVKSGRNPDATYKSQGKNLSIYEMSKVFITLLEQMSSHLSELKNDSSYKTVTSRYIKSLLSGISLSEMVINTKGEKDYMEWGLSQSHSHSNSLLDLELDSDLNNKLEKETIESHRKHKEIEDSSEGDFEDFLEKYFEQIRITL